MIIQRKVSTWSWQATTIRRFADLAFHYLKFKKASKTSLIENKLKNKTTTKKNILERNILSMLESMGLFKNIFYFSLWKFFVLQKIYQIFTIERQFISFHHVLNFELGILYLHWFSLQKYTSVKIIDTLPPLKIIDHCIDTTYLS